MKTLHILFTTSLILATFLIIPSYVNTDSHANSKMPFTTLSYIPYSSIFVGTMAYASNDTNSSKITPEELNKNLETAREKISNIMMNNTTNIPFNMVGINIINSTLEVGIDSAKATLSAEQYKEKIREIVGDVPITLVIGHIQLLGNNTSRQDNSSTSSVMSPLKQFRSGIAAKDVKCGQGFQLVIKTEDGSPACVTPNTANILVEHGWATNVPQPNPMTGLNNDTGIATLGNHTYYFETPNYTETAYVNPAQISFHDVIFTLFPSGFRGGLPAWGCGGGYYWTDAQFSDGTIELLQIFVGSKDCFLPQPSTHFSTHTNPQAGLTFYDGKMKLLVSTSVTNSSGTQLPASFMPCDTPYPSGTGIAVLYMPMNSIGKLCVQYSNPNSPQPVGVRIFEAHHISQDTQDVTVTADHDTIPTGNSTVAYDIKTTNQAGFYGFTIFCEGTPLAVGYDNSSTIVEGDFPWLGQTFYCPNQSYDYHIVGLTGIGVKYIP